MTWLTANKKAPGGALVASIIKRPSFTQIYAQLIELSLT